ncbi:hypothetical protein HDC90_005178 [Pedobacter sp. AK013]|uniref:hypothetical protein n=1 Tax=Pedobacter sp. AK013 TaxID=2723071 RepID=UPI0016219BD7|nr:hypothetical protein [Pedobacter sp. AK013]MBB6240501.1 hypothetical protein [Pedobacter sp. AK013]
MSGPTNNNHYVPCFWSALWNTEYYDLKIAGANAPSARTQMLHVLNIKSDTIYSCKAEKIFYKERLGHIPITREEYLELTKFDGSPPKEQNLFDDDNSIVIMDIENHFSMFEESIGYESIFRLMKDHRSIDNYGSKVEISAFLFYHPYRASRYLLDLFEKYSASENNRLDAFYEWKYFMNKDSHALAITQILEGKWTVYALERFSFPICDNPVLNDGKKIYAIISPKHLITVDLLEKSDITHFKNTIGYIEYKRLLRKIITNTDSVIAHTNKDTLERLQKSNFWKKTRQIKK